MGRPKGSGQKQLSAAALEGFRPNMIEHIKDCFKKDEDGGSFEKRDKMFHELAPYMFKKQPQAVEHSTPDGQPFPVVLIPS